MGKGGHMEKVKTKEKTIKQKEHGKFDDSYLKESCYIPLNLKPVTDEGREDRKEVKKKTK